MVSNNDRLPDVVQRALDACTAQGVPWRLTRGTRHRQLYVGGQRVAVLHFGAAKQTGYGKAYYNIIASIRRRAAEVVGGQG